jgi:hypothetical protein
VTQQPEAAAPPVVRHRPASGLMAFCLGTGAILYTAVAVGFAGYLLWKAYKLPPNSAQTDFDKLAIAALVAVIGTGLTGLAAVYSATRQSATAYQVAEYNAVISTNLAQMKTDSDAALTEMKARLDASLAQLKAASDESLTRLKIALDAGQVAYRELFGTAAVYFHALRSIARGKWEADSLKVGETSMISATRHLIHVNKEMRDQWFDFWQRAQDIQRAASTEADAEKRPGVVAELFDQKIQYDAGWRDFRDLYAMLESTARRATDTPAPNHAPQP